MCVWGCFVGFACVLCLVDLFALVFVDCCFGVCV